MTFFKIFPFFLLGGSLEHCVSPTAIEIVTMATSEQWPVDAEFLMGDQAGGQL